MSKKSTNKQTRKVYGWYSAKQHQWTKDYINFMHNRNTDCHIYLGEYGNEVICTEVSSSNICNSNFDDMICLGIMTKWLRNDVKPIQHVQPISNVVNLLNSIET